MRNAKRGESYLSLSLFNQGGKMKKPTMKEVVAKVEMLNRVNTTVIDMVTNLGDALKQYIEYKDDAKDFHE